MVGSVAEEIRLLENSTPFNEGYILVPVAKLAAIRAEVDAVAKEMYDPCVVPRVVYGTVTILGMPDHNDVKRWAARLAPEDK